MEEEKQEEEKFDLNKACDVIKEKLKELTDNGYRQENSKYWGDTVDILKDIYEIKQKEETNMYRNFSGNYNDRYNNYSENIGRRGVPGTGRGRYRGEEMLDEMKYHYGNYQDSYNAGNYGAKEDSSYKMTEAFKEFVYAVGEELEPKDKQMFKQAMQEMVQRLN